jgi:hypothetical protein
MLFHMSFAARDPRHVAEVIAELWDGVAAPFPPVIAGSWAAVAHDDRNTAIEIYPLHTTLHPAEGDRDAFGLLDGRDERSAGHAAIATVLDQAAVFAIAAREGWPAKYRRRGGLFGVIELWVEGRQMLEILTAEMEAEYRDCMTAENWLASPR